MKYQIYKNSSGVIIPVWAQDLTSVVGGGLTGVSPSSSGLKSYYKKNTDSSLTLFTTVPGTVGTYVASGLVAVSNTNAPGDLELCLPNAAFNAPVGSGNYFLTATLYGVANMLPIKVDIQLIDPPSASTGGGNIDEPTSVPSFPCTSDAMISWLFARASNLETCTETQAIVYKSDNTTPLATATLSDNGTVLTRSKYS